jgi:uncharacterized protein YjaZ
LLEITKQEEYQPVGLSFDTIYAISYKVVQVFLKKTSSDIYEVLLPSTKEIIQDSDLF